MAEIKAATDATFEELVLKNDKPVVVDFWAAWCGPCKMVAPEMEKLAAKYDGVVDVVKVDVDANPRLSQAFKIMSIPTIAFFKPGAQPQGVVGFRPLEQLETAFGLTGLAAPEGLTPGPQRGPITRTNPRSPTGGSVVRRSCAATTRAARRCADRTQASARSSANRSIVAGVKAIQPAPRADAAVSGVLRAAFETAGSRAASRRSSPRTANTRPFAEYATPSDARRRSTPPSSADHRLDALVRDSSTAHPPRAAAAAASASSSGASSSGPSSSSARSASGHVAVAAPCAAHETASRIARSSFSWSS